MKKIITLIIIIILAAIAFFVAKDLVSQKKAMAQNINEPTKEVNTTNNSNLPTKNITTAQNTNNQSSLNASESNSNNKNVGTNSIPENNSNITNNANSTTYHTNLNNNANTQNTTNIANNTNSATQSNKENNTVNGTITYNSQSSSTQKNSIVITNTTNNPIPLNKLTKYMRNWIIADQSDSNGINAATFWAKPWLDKTSNKLLIQAFINANGDNSLSKNITFSELKKATLELNKLTLNAVPFTLPEAKALILTALQKDGYANPDQVTKITFTQGEPSVYTVYTKQSKNWPFWTVYANTGYAHG